MGDLHHSTEHAGAKKGTDDGPKGDWRVQLKQSLAHMDYESQLDAVRPPQPVESAPSEPVQMAGSGGELSSEQVHTVAEQGVSGSGGSLPFQSQIQHSFGRHDISDVQGHTGSTAARANRSMGALAYTKGNQIAFRKSPSLHTAAHEAAHVVQQRAGVSLPGGVGRSGDAYERHADAVADRVVQGKSAEDLLDTVSGSGGAPVVQKEDFRAPAEVNPAEKVAFEGELAAAILNNPGLYMGTIRSVTTAMYGVIDQIAQAVVNDATTEASTTFETLKADMKNRLNITDDSYFGRPPAFDVPKAEVGAELQKFLTEGGNVEHHVMAHGMFYWNVYEKSFKAEDAKPIVSQKVQEAIQGWLDAKFGSPGTVREATSGEGGNPFADRGRQRQEDETPPRTTGITGLNPRQADGSNPDTQDVSGEGYDIEYVRGMDTLKLDVDNPYIKHALETLKMPMAGGVSGTTGDLMDCAKKIGSLSGDPLKEYGLGVMGVLGGIGAHSFHEIATVFQAAGIAYTPGSYKGVYPASFTGSGAFNTLKTKYPEFLA